VATPQAQPLMSTPTNTISEPVAFTSQTNVAPVKEEADDLPNSMMFGANQTARTADQIPEAPVDPNEGMVCTMEEGCISCGS